MKFSALRYIIVMKINARNLEEEAE
jgi:hypothetical protein